MKAIGVFGGTFDPVHLGHIQMAKEVKQSLNLDEVRLLPCHQPPHRVEPQLTSEQRLALLRLAVDGIDGLLVDDRELRRDEPSWTVETLKDLRLELGSEISITVLMGADAYSYLTSWYQWQELPRLAHIGVFRRPGYRLPKTGILADWLTCSYAYREECENTDIDCVEKPSTAPSVSGVMDGVIGDVIDNADRIRLQPAGSVIVVKQPQVDLSATSIREQLSNGCLPQGLAPAVSQYIVDHQLYGFNGNCLDNVSER